MRKDDPSCARGLKNKDIKLELGTVAQSAKTQMINHFVDQVYPSVL